MPERGFATETWDSDEWFQELPRDQRYLFIYLWTNNHCNQAALYHITLTTIAFEAKFSKEELPDLLNSLSPKVIWYPTENLIWVKNFIKRQSKSSKFLAAVAKSLTSIHNNGAVKELLDYNLQRYSILIPYQYYMDKVSILTRVTASDTSPVSNAGGVRVVKGKGELSSEEKGLIGCLGQLKGWQADEDDIHWLQGLRSEYPGFALAEFKACVDYHSGKPVPKHKGIWKNRFRNWMIKKREFELKGGKKGETHRRGDKEPSAEEYRQSLE